MSCVGNKHNFLFASFLFLVCLLFFSFFSFLWQLHFFYYLYIYIDDNVQEELFRILESNNSSDSLEDDFSSSSDSCYQSADDSFDSPNIKIGCRDSCCNVVNTVNTLTKTEEDEKLIIQLINQIQNPEL